MVGSLKTEHDRQAPLRCAVKRHDQCGELILRHVLQLVDEDEGSIRRLRCLTRSLDQVLEVVLQIAIVRQTGLRVEVKSDFNVLVSDSEGSGEPSERSQAASRQLSRLLGARDSQQCCRGRGQPGDRLSARRAAVGGRNPDDGRVRRRVSDHA